MRHWLIAFTLAVTAPALLAGCGTGRAIEERKAIAQATFAFDRVTVERADIPFTSPDAGADLQVVLRVTNPNDITARLDRMDYQVFIEDAAVGTGLFPGGFAVEPGQTAELALPLTIRYTSLPGTVMQAIQARKGNVTVQGTSHISTAFGTLDYPITLQRHVTF
jgi:LEA14-like dessication related protein